MSYLGPYCVQIRLEKRRNSRAGILILFYDAIEHIKSRWISGNIIITL